MQIYPINFNNNEQSNFIEMTGTPRIRNNKRRVTQSPALTSGDPISARYSYRSLKTKTSIYRRKLRFDMFGTPILKNQKGHKVCFKSEIQEIVQIENWKQLNQTQLKQNMNESEICCPHCSLF